MPSITSAQVRTDVEGIIRRIRPELHGSIGDSDRLRDDLGLDSLHSMELLSEISEMYELDVDPEELHDVRTVGDVASFLTTLLGKSNSAL
jgi:acyl carrier protein